MPPVVVVSSQSGNRRDTCRPNALLSIRALHCTVCIRDPKTWLKAHTLFTVDLLTFNIVHIIYCLMPSHGFGKCISTDGFSTTVVHSGKLYSIK